MNKKIILSLVLVSLVTLPFIAGAQPSAKIGSLDQLVSTLESALWTIFGAIAVVMFVVAGMLFLTASGDPEKIKSARNAAIWGVAGVVVGIMAYSIVEIVSSML